MMYLNDIMKSTIETLNGVDSNEDSGETFS